MAYIVVPCVIILIIGIFLGILLAKLIPSKTRLTLKISVALIAVASCIIGLFGTHILKVIFPMKEVRLKKDINITEDYYFNSKNYPPDEWADIAPKIENPPYQPKAQGILKKGSILKQHNSYAPCAYLDLTIAVKKTDIEDVK